MSYTAFHLALQRGFLVLFWLLVAALVCSGLVAAVAWLNHWWQHRRADRESHEHWLRHGSTWSSADPRQRHDAFTRHRRTLK